MHLPRVNESSKKPNYNIMFSADATNLITKNGLNRLLCGIDKDTGCFVLANATNENESARKINFMGTARYASISNGCLVSKIRESFGIPKDIVYIKLMFLDKCKDAEGGFAFMFNQYDVMGRA